MMDQNDRIGGAVVTYGLIVSLGVLPGIGGIISLLGKFGVIARPGMGLWPAVVACQVLVWVLMFLACRALARGD